MLVIKLIVVVFFLLTSDRDSSPGQDLEEILRDLLTLRVNSEGRTTVNVRRGHIWEDSSQCYHFRLFCGRFWK